LDDAEHRSMLTGVMARHAVSVHRSESSTLSLVTDHE
jgi:hypothetical protein